MGEVSRRSSDSTETIAMIIEVLIVAAVGGTLLLGLVLVIPLLLGGLAPVGGGQ